MMLPGGRDSNESVSIRPTPGAPFDFAASFAAATFEASSFGSCLELDGPTLLVRRPVALHGGVGGLLRGAPAAGGRAALPPTRTTVGFEATCSPFEPERPDQDPDAKEQDGKDTPPRHIRGDGPDWAGPPDGGGSATVAARV